ncbi:signal peptide peptidase SppA [Paenochrobactrum pullorum]|uniref:signal peptide peptidase SppA n=1 Tax=Paenochrobactrum pullorum TaxID=1324351 RepID=UPI0035BC26E7
MTQTADAMIDRRRIRRKLTFWRGAFLIVLALALIAIATTQSSNFIGLNTPHIAKVRIEGTITQNEELLKRLELIAKNDAVKGLIVIVDSPGGTTVGGETIFNAIRKIAEKKPVVTSVGNLAASAGYMIAVASDHIVAHQSSIVGSIGVLFQYPDISELMNKIGVKMEAVKSSPMKAEPNFFNPASEETKAMIRNMIMDSYDWFVGLVETRRSFTREETLALADGSIFTGRQALEKKLIDGLGGEEAAREWLLKKGLSPDLSVIEWKPEKDETLLSMKDLLVRGAVRMFGLPDDSHHFIRDTISERIFLDGLLSVMQVTDTVGHK